MIKVQGFARRRDGMTHDDCVRHHREVHSKLGLAQADHMGKYVLYYFEEAFGGDGSPLPDLPWDMSALEWYTDEERWHNFQDWLETAPDGQEVKTDEASFLDRERCYLLPYDENVVVDEPANDAIHIFRVLTARDGVSETLLRDRHADQCIPAIRKTFGRDIRKYVVNYITEATSLANGRSRQLAKRHVSAKHQFPEASLWWAVPRDVRAEFFAGSAVQTPRRPCRHAPPLGLAIGSILSG